MGAAGLLKNPYERYCERQRLEAISALALLFLVFLDCFVVLAPRKDNEKNFFNRPAAPYFKTAQRLPLIRLIELSFFQLFTYFFFKSRDINPGTTPIYINTLHDRSISMLCGFDTQNIRLLL